MWSPRFCGHNAELICWAQKKERLKWDLRGTYLVVKGSVNSKIYVESLRNNH